MKKQKISIMFTEIQNPSPPCEKLANHGIDLTLAEKVSSKSIDITDGMIRVVILSFIHEMFVKRPLWARHLQSGQPCLEDNLQEVRRDYR